MRQRAQIIAYLFFAIALLGNILFWQQTHDRRAVWANVPPVPAERALSGFFLGDRQLAYRATGMMLQNLGDGGGRIVPLDDYNYDHLGQWFFAADRMDSQADYIPFLAAYYFSATQKSENLVPVVDYLEHAGQGTGAQKWRWLAQAVYLSRYRTGDLNRALELATLLSDMWKPGRPAWMKQMPAFVLSAQGDRQAAYDLTLQILKEQAEALDPSEVRYMVSYICHKILEPGAAEVHQLCQQGD